MQPTHSRRHQLQFLAVASLLIVLLPVAPLAAQTAAAKPAAAASANTQVTRAQLVNANFRQGMLAFQQRCSACHSAAEGGLDLLGPNLYGVFKRRAGSKSSFKFSPALVRADFVWSPQRLAAWIGDPTGYLPGNIMALPEPVPEADRVPLLSYLMLETGAADWPRPQMPRAARVDPSKPLAERYPTFWNHLMNNTTRYRLIGAQGEFPFDAYFEKNGAVRSNLPAIRGFWHVDEREMFCYALYGVPAEPNNIVECFPVVAMSIPRFNDSLWETQVAPGIKLRGGIVAGRPEPPAPK